MRALSLSAVAAVLFLTIPKAARADDFPQRRARIILKVAIDTGTPLFNDGDHEDCYRVYRGALQSIMPLLRDRPDLRKHAAWALRRAAHTSSSTDQAWILRHAIDRTLARLD